LAAGEAAGKAPDPASAPAAGHGYPLRVETWLYTLSDDTGAETDETRALESIPMGEKLFLITAEPRKATNRYDSKVYDYYRVRRDTGKSLPQPQKR
jgi:hypothetical protein